MSLERSIKSGKDKRKPFYGSKCVDKSCRNGSKNPCPVCEGNRTFRNRKNKLKGT